MLPGQRWIMNQVPFHEAMSPASPAIPKAALSVFDWPQHDRNRPGPPVVRPGGFSTQERPGHPPSDAVVLFDGTSLDAWAAPEGSPAPWRVTGGWLECIAGAGNIRTIQAFGDCQLHLEWAAPNPPDGTGQARGNSGVFLMGLYEIQILDSYENPTYADGCAGAVYGQHPPLANASLPPGGWQSYDILFARPRFHPDGRLHAPARLTVFHNGIVVQNHVELVGPTGWLLREPYRPHPDKLPLALQDHGSPVRFRNIWIRELDSDARDPEFLYGHDTLDRLTGRYQADGDLSIRITRDGDHLHAAITLPGKTIPFPLHAASPLEFYARSFDGRLAFQDGPDGHVDSLVFRLAGQDRVARRVPFLQTAPSAACSGKADSNCPPQH